MPLCRTCATVYIDHVDHTQLSECGKMSFEPLIVHTHIRALHFHRPILFIGCGNRLDVVDCHNNNVIVSSRTIFSGFNINGITSEVDQEKSASEFNLVLHGNRFLTIFKFAVDNARLDQVCSPYNFSDWIVDVRLRDKLVFVVLAHNQVAVFDSVLHRVVSIVNNEIQCILYCAHLISVAVDSFCLAAGTVFKEIVIWSQLDGQAQCLQKLRGHDGVIFAIDYNQQLNTLASASDDRSVRIWTEEGVTSDGRNKVWTKANFCLKHILYSHESRIWKIAILSNPCNILISVGEDASICFWNVDSGVLIRKEKLRKNVTIWSLEIDSESLVAFTGASDSSVLSWDICQVIQEAASAVCLEFNSLNIPKALVLTRCPQQKRFFVLLGDGQFLFISSDCKSKLNFYQNEIFHDYCTSDINDTRDLIVLGSKCGQIAIVDLKNELISNLEITQGHEGKVFSVCFANKFNVISCGPKGVLKIWDLQLKNIGTCLLPHSRHQWPTASVLIKQLLVVGDGSGNVFIYNNSNEAASQSYRNLHGHNGVTCIQMKPGSDFLYTCGRNGKIFEFVIKEDSCVLLRVFKIYADMEWISRLIFDDLTGNLNYVIGFNGKDFIVWSEIEARFVWAAECGGGHRLWDFQIYDDFFHFNYTKQDQILSLRKKISTAHNLASNSMNNCSSKKINCCSTLQFEKPFNCSTFYFASGGEDNQVYINCVNYSVAKSHVESILCGHISNIAGLDSCPSNHEDNTCYLVSVGGRSQLIIWAIQINEEKSVCCQQVVCNYLKSHEKIQRKPWKVANDIQQINSIPEFRYLDVKIAAQESNDYLICTTCSDPAIRLFLFKSKQSDIVLLHTINYRNCVFNCRLLDASHLMVGTSDGILRLIFLNSLLVNSGEKSDSFNSKVNDFEFKLHQSGINALDVFQLKDKFWLIATGGDDNKITLNLVSIFGNDKIKKITDHQETNTHVSQITGIQFLSADSLLSVSTDQRVVRWHFDCNVNDAILSLVPVCFYVTCVADVTCLSLFKIDQQTQLAIVSGEGCEVIKCFASS